MWIILSIILGSMYSEFIGYFLHKLLHSEKIQWLSKNHMIHHLKEYGPKMPMRTSSYTSSGNAINPISIGLEWIVPLFLAVSVSVTLLLLLGLSILHTSIFISVAIVWGLLMFSYMHDALHLKNFWMLNNRYLAKWFKDTRKLHDIHHVRLTDEGQMHVNFGICFFWMDKLFGTYKTIAGRFNKKGFNAAKKRYSFIYERKPNGTKKEKKD